MRLFQRQGTFYIEMPGGKRRSTKTRDKRKALRIFNELQKEMLLGNIVALQKSDSPTISEFLKIYLRDRADLADKTHEADTTALNKLKDAIGDRDLTNIRTKHIIEFKAICKASGIKPVSTNTYLRHIKSALNYAHANKYMDEVPTIKYNKTPAALPRVIHPGDVEKILDYAREKNFEMSRVITFALYTGCRRNEMLNFRYEDITDGVAIIHGKGNKERIVPLVEQATDVISPMQDIGKVFRYKHYSTFSNYFRKIAKACNVDARFHDLRHTSATQMLKSGIPIEVVQKILGHSDLRTTQIYAKVLSATLSKEMKKLSF